MVWINRGNDKNSDEHIRLCGSFAAFFILRCILCPPPRNRSSNKICTVLDCLFLFERPTIATNTHSDQFVYGISIRIATAYQIPFAIQCVSPICLTSTIADYYLCSLNKDNFRNKTIKRTSASRHFSLSIARPARSLARTVSLLCSRYAAATFSRINYVDSIFSWCAEQFHFIFFQLLHWKLGNCWRNNKKKSSTHTYPITHSIAIIIINLNES